MLQRGNLSGGALLCDHPGLLDLITAKPRALLLGDGTRGRGYASTGRYGD